MVYYQSLATTVQGFIAKGMRKFVVTSSGGEEGKSTITANLGRALAKSGKATVVLVDADQVKPDLHTLFGLENGRGVGDALKELYQTDLARANPHQFGLGDWMELLHVQARTGNLLVAQNGQKLSILFHKGRISRVDWGGRREDRRLGDLLITAGKITKDQRDAALRLQQETHAPLGDVLCGLGYAEPADMESALQAQINDAFYTILALRQPAVRFSETACGDPCSESQNGGAVNGLLPRVLRTPGQQPFLSGQLSRYLRDTEVENLKLLTSGAIAYHLQDWAVVQQFKAMLDTLSRKFGVVLIDSPPVSLNSPATTLATLADGVLFVVKSNGLDLPIIRHAKEELEKVEANLLGVVLNQVDVTESPELFRYYGTLPK